MSDTMMDYVKPNIHVVSPTDDVIEVYKLMKKYTVRHIPVVEGTKTVGIISDRDVQFVAHVEDGLSLKAKDVMSEDPYSVDSMMSIPHVVNTMVQNRYSSVLIHDQAKKVVGIFTSTDAMKVLADHYKSL